VEVDRGWSGNDAPTDGETAEKLVAQALTLRDRGQTTELDLLGVELQGVLRELEPLLDERGELADAATLLAEDLLGVGSTDNDLRRSSTQSEPISQILIVTHTSVRAWVTRTSQPE
jgi:hypothetical protein